MQNIHPAIAYANLCKLGSVIRGQPSAAPGDRWALFFHLELFDSIFFSDFFFASRQREICDCVFAFSRCCALLTPGRAEERDANELAAGNEAQVRNPGAKY